jgi:hypothetical protein
MHSLLGIEFSRTLAHEKDRAAPVTETRARRPRLAQLFRQFPVRRRGAKAATVARSTT